MAEYTERQVVGKLEILEDGQIQVRQDTVILRDGVEIHRTYHRRVLTPTLTPVDAQEDARIKAVTAGVWTPAVVEAYERAKPTPETADIPETPKSRV